MCEVCDKHYQPQIDEANKEFLDNAERALEEINMSKAVTRMKVRISYIAEGRNEDGKQSETVYANAVYDPNPESENAQFSKATPCVNLTAVIDNPGAFGKIESSKEYYLDWVPVEDDEN